MSICLYWELYKLSKWNASIHFLELVTEKDCLFYFEYDINHIQVSLRGILKLWTMTQGFDEMNIKSHALFISFTLIHVI